MLGYFRTVSQLTVLRVKWYSVTVSGKVSKQMLDETVTTIRAMPQYWSEAD
jgi:hypothetical protein